MDPRSDCSQVKSDLDLRCLSTRLQDISAGDESRQLVVIDVLEVITGKCEYSIYTITIVVRGSNNLLLTS